MERPLVSAVITTCKRPAETVARALRSVLAQTYSPIEIFIIDDSPADYPERTKVAAYMADRQGIVYLQNEKNSGACFSRNRGLSLAGGKYVAFLDDDDEWLPEKIEKAVATLEASDAKMVYSFAKQYRDDTGEWLPDLGRAFTGDFYSELLHTTNFIGGVSFPVLEREALLAIGGFDTEMESAQDFDLWLRMAKNYPVVCVGEPLTVYHWHSGEQISRNPKKKISGITRILEKNADYFAEHPADLPPYQNSLAKYYAMDGQKAKARSMWRKSLRGRPFALKETLRVWKWILKK